MVYDPSELQLFRLGAVRRDLVQGRLYICHQERHVGGVPDRGRSRAIEFLMDYCYWKHI